VGPFLPGPLPPASPQPVIDLAELAAVLEHPIRAFLRQRLGLSLRTYDDRPVDALDLDLDGLARWEVGKRLLDAFLTGRDPDAICAAERSRGLLPPGVLGERVLAQTRERADRLATSARDVVDGPRGSLEIDVLLADGRQVVGTVAEVFAGGSVIRPVTYPSLAAKLKLRTWVDHLAASASPAGPSPTSVLVARWGGRARSFGLAPLDADTARAHLLDLADLRDEALRAPLPLYAATSSAWATSRLAGDDDPRGAANKEWTSDFRWSREDRDTEHILVYGGERTLDEVLADPAFAPLALRVWTPVLDRARRWSS
jgi:exodeoxyribonuclease V gamma subunit